MGTCGHTNTRASTYFPTADLSICSHCRAVVTKPYDDVIRDRDAEIERLREVVEYLDVQWEALVENRDRVRLSQRALQMADALQTIHAGCGFRALAATKEGG